MYVLLGYFGYKMNSGYFELIAGIAMANGVPARAKTYLLYHRYQPDCIASQYTSGHLKSLISTCNQDQTHPHDAFIICLVYAYVHVFPLGLHRFLVSVWVSGQYL